MHLGWGWDVPRIAATTGVDSEKLKRHLHKIMEDLKSKGEELVSLLKMSWISREKLADHAGCSLADLQTLLDGQTLSKSIQVTSREYKKSHIDTASNCAVIAVAHGWKGKNHDQWQSRRIMLSDLANDWNKTMDYIIERLTVVSQAAKVVSPVSDMLLVGLIDGYHILYGRGTQWPSLPDSFRHLFGQTMYGLKERYDRLQRENSVRVHTSSQPSAHTFDNNDTYPRCVETTIGQRGNF
jgi:hypothetical protein